MTVTEAMRAFERARDELYKHGIHDIGGYAELLVCRAFGAVRNASGVEKGYDLVCAKRGRIEVRSRIQPRSGRKEERFQVPAAKVNGFAVFVGVLFSPDVAVVGGFALPHDLAIELAQRQKHLRIPYALGSRYGEDITPLLQSVQASL